MAILIYCSKCNRPFSRKLNNCPICSNILRNVNKFWINLPQPNGRRKTRVFEGNLTAARRFEAKLKTDIMLEKNWGIKKAPFIHDVYKKFEKWNRRNGKTSKHGSSRWKVHIAPYITSTMRMNQLTAHDINKILDRMRENGGRNGDGCAPATIKHALGAIKRLYNWAWENDLYNGENPTAKIKPPKFDNKITNCLTKPQTKQLFNILENWENQRAALVIKFALYTGCRKSEIFKLTWKDVDFDNKFIHLRDPKGKPTTLPISQKACDVLIEARKLNRKSKYVFANRAGKQRKHFGATWARIKKKARLPKEFRFHDFRHNFASKLISSGKVDLYRLQKLLNHQSPSMTQRYAHLADKALRDAANSVDDVFD